MAAQRRLGVALASKQSVPGGAKIHTIDLTGGTAPLEPEKTFKEGQVDERVPTSSGFWSETKNTAVDARGERVFQVGGKSQDLKQCSKCQLVS